MYVSCCFIYILQGPLQLESSEESPEEHEDDIPDEVNLRTVPYLPVRYVLSDGTPIIIRSLQDREEIRSYYAAIKAAAATGDGYGLDELPCIGYFVRWYVNGFYNFVYELDSTSSQSQESISNTSDIGHVATSSRRTVIAYANFGLSLFSRSVNNSILSDGNIVMLPEFRGRRWANEIHEVQFTISYDVGYKRVFGETSVKNMGSILSMRRNGATITGSIPRGIYIKDVGWMDLVTLYFVLNESYAEKQRKSMQRQLASKI